MEQALDYSFIAVQWPGRQYLNPNGLSCSLLSEAHRSHLETSAEQPEQASSPAATTSVVVMTPVLAGLFASVRRVLFSYTFGVFSDLFLSKGPVYTWRKFAAAKSADVDQSEPILLAVLDYLLGLLLLLCPEFIFNIFWYISLFLRAWIFGRRIV